MYISECTKSCMANFVFIEEMLWKFKYITAAYKGSIFHSIQAQISHGTFQTL